MTSEVERIIMPSQWFKGGVMEISQEVQNAFNKAQKALAHSHAPYSKLHVASSIKFHGLDDVVCGVNVENASYGATICAERSAICSATSQYGPQKVDFVIVISDFKGGPIPPCGMCLQVLQEFVTKDSMVYLGDSQSLSKSYLFSELVPHGFDSEMLPESQA